MADQEVGLTSMSTSTAASPEYDSCCYDVFINHRGPDVKRTFASHLYHRLLREKLRVFLDKSELERGLRTWVQIKAAIRSAPVHVALFSPRYAESEWCLNELVEMSKSRDSIIPVFYHVNRADLKGESGVYVQSLRKLEEEPRHDPSTIQKWRKSLFRASQMAALQVDAKHTDEGEVLDQVVERVLCKIGKKRSPDCPRKFWPLSLIVGFILSTVIIFILVYFISTKVIIKNLKI